MTPPRPQDPPGSPEGRPGHGARSPRQARSQRTHDRIVRAAGELLESRPFDEISVADIARAAGTSVGGFYARFPSKDALLHGFDDAFADSLIQEAEHVLDPARWEGVPVREIVAAYISMAVTGFRRHRSVLRQVALHSRISRDDAFRDRVRRVNRQLHDRFRALLHDRADALDHTDPTRAIDLGLIAVSAAMRESILFDETRPDFATFDDDELVAELTDMYCAYLRAKETS